MTNELQETYRRQQYLDHMQDRFIDEVTRQLRIPLTQLQGNKATPEVLEAFAERLAETVIKGDLQIEDYRPNDAASNQAIKVRFV